MARPQLERLVGPRAYLVGRARHPDLVLPEPVPPLWPNWNPPPAPYVPDGSLSDQARWLRRVWVASCAHHGYHLETLGFLAFAEPGRRPAVQAALEAAVRFFRGQDRTGLSEFYEDGRRKIPEQLAPHVWCAWSIEQWRWVSARRAERPSARKPPPLQWVFGPSRFRSPRAVNHFTHWDGGDVRSWTPPLRLAATDLAGQTFSLYRELICTHGWSCRADLVELRARTLGHFYRYERLLREARRELAQLNSAAERLLQDGAWVWK